MTNLDNTKSHYLIYARRSTDDMEHQKNSIDYQVDACRRYALGEHLRIAEATITSFCEAGVVRERHTAFKTPRLEVGRDGVVRYRIERPKFQRLVMALVQVEFQGVICLCWDRLSRNSHDDAVIKDLIGRGVDMRFVQTTYDRSSSGALHMDIDGMFAAHHSRVTSEKVRATIAKLRSEGKCASRAPIGYLDQGPGCKPLDPVRAPIIKRLFELYATGEWSYRELTKWALQQGLTTKPERPHRTRSEILSGEESRREPVSSPVTMKTVEKILGNPFYAGFLKHEGVEMPGIHEPLIAVALFRQVEQVRKGRTISLHYAEKEFFTYRGLVRCLCGRGYSPYRKKGHAYYRVPCRSSCGSTRVNIQEWLLDSLVTDLLGRIHFSERELSQIERMAPKAFSAADRRRKEAFQELERRQIRAQRDLNYLQENKITLLREGAYDSGGYAEEVRRLEAEVERVKEERAAAEGAKPAEMIETVFQFSELVRLAKDCYKHATEEERRRLATAVVSELVVRDGELAKVSAREGFRELLERPGVPSSVLGAN